MSVEENGRLIQSSLIIPAAGPRYQRRCKGRFDALPLRALLLLRLLPFRLPPALPARAEIKVVVVQEWGSRRREGGGR